MYNAPTVDDFKTFFSRDFPFGTTTDKVMDADVTRALLEANTLINPSLFGEQADYATAYLYLAAHNLVTNLKNSSAGLAGGFPFLATSQGVGSVSVGYQIPEAILSGPLAAFLAQTPYGARYLFLIQGLLVGNVGCVSGATLP